MREKFEEYNVYSVYDEVEENFGFLFLSPSDEAARRLCFKGFLQNDSVSDLVLYQIGVLDISTGLLDGLRPIRRVLRIGDLFASKEDDVNADA